VLYKIQSNKNYEIGTVMYRTITILSTIFLCSCSSVTVGNGQSKVIIKSEKPICNLKEIDENCRLNTDYAWQSHYL